MNAWVRAREKVVFNIARILRALTGFVAVRSLNEVRIESSVKLLLSKINREKSCTNAE